MLLEFAGIFTGIATANREMHIVILGMRSEGKTLKNGEPTFGSSFMTMLQHTSQFCLRIS
jgi:hypothetical protein